MSALRADYLAPYRVVVGTHSLSSPSHISLLIHKTFNVSIPLPHIPSDLYRFDAALADTPPPLSPSPSPEPEPELAAPEGGMEVDSDGEEVKPEEDQEEVEARLRAKEEKERVRQEEKEARRAEKERLESSSGRWRSAMSGKVLGDGEEEVEFTVVA